MARLTNQIKIDIIDSAVDKAGITAKREKLRARRAKWAEEVRVQSVGGKDADKKINSIKKRFEKAISNLPVDVTKSNIFCRRNAITVNVSGLHVEAYFNGETNYIGDQVKGICNYSYTLKSGDKLVDDFMSIDKERESIESEIDKISTNVRGALDQITTVKKLLQVWPEAEELLPKNVYAKPKDNLPAVLTKDLNKLIGIPSEENKKKSK